MGPEVYSLDGLDAQPRNARRCVLDAWLPAWLAGVDHRSDEPGLRKIGNGIEPAVGRYRPPLRSGRTFNGNVRSKT